jgi:dTDP-4-amino-4,6-dideoxygalactose transaminase
VIRSERADELGAALRDRGIEARAYYRRPIHRQPALAVELDLPGTDEAARTSLALPIGPTLSAAQVEEVAVAIRTSLAA